MPQAEQQAHPVVVEEVFRRAEVNTERGAVPA